MSRNIFPVCKSNIKNTFQLWKRYGAKTETLPWIYRDLQRLALSVYDEERLKRDYSILEDILRAPYEIVDNFPKTIETAFAILEQHVGQTVSINKVREIQRFLWMKGGDGNFKIAIIDGAENMNDEASNSFLKVSEDTPADSIIIIIAVNKELLKETIRSRFRPYRFLKIGDKAKREILREHFGMDNAVDFEFERSDYDTMKSYTSRLFQKNVNLKEMTEVIDEIISNDSIALFFDYLLQLLKEKARSLEEYQMSEVYEFEERMKTIFFIKRGIQNNNINRELAFTNYILNNFSYHLK
jgi:DNA polymerase III delta prime subunit